MPLFISLCFIIAGIFIAPVFLDYSHRLDDIDSVLVMIGPQKQARFKEAEQLLRKKQAKALLIPAFSQVVFHNASRAVKRKQALNLPGVQINKSVNLLGFRIEFVESSHLELIRGKMIMDQLGFRTAMIVSSPYHMLRLKLIGDRVFRAKKYKIGYAPSRFVDYGLFSWLKSWEYLQNALAEYPKMAWFLIYAKLV